MRIGFDCVKLVKGTSKSIGIYNVTKSVITRLALESDGNTVVVLGNENNREDFETEGVEFHSIELDINSRKAILLWETFRVNSYIKKLKLDEVVFPRGFTSLFCPVRDVIIIHDLIPFYYNKNYPGEFSKLQNGYVMLRMKRSIQTADRIITISDYSKKDIVKLVPKADSKTAVILHGYEKHGRQGLVNPEPGMDYFFASTSMLPHKNVAGILKAYIRYYETAGKPYDLVLAGISDLSLATGKYHVDVPESVTAHIHCKKYMDDNKYYSYFAYSKGLIFLSFIEGFGLPPLEAMELGVPVICSDRTSLPEVVRNAGILVDPDDTDAVVRAMQKITDDGSAAEQLVKAGFENLKGFDWGERIKQYKNILFNGVREND